MPNGGKLTVNALVQNGEALISVADNGVGIPEEIKDKIFTPSIHNEIERARIRFSGG